MTDFSETVRNRVRRETQIFAVREKLSAWEFAARIASSKRLPQSSRFNAPKLSHRTIASFLAGAKSHPSTIAMLRDYLVIETGLHPGVFAVDDALVRFASGASNFVAPQRIPATNIATQYTGVYTVCAKEDGPYSFTLVVDFEPVYRVLLVRGLVRVEGSEHAEFVEGFLNPSTHQFEIRLRKPALRSEFSILISHEGKFAPFIDRAEPPHTLRANAFAPAAVMAPTIEDGCWDTEAYSPGMYAKKLDRFVVSYRIYRAHPSHEASIDVFRDGVNIETGWVQLGARPKEIESRHNDHELRNWFDL